MVVFTVARKRQASRFRTTVLFLLQVVNIVNLAGGIAGSLRFTTFDTSRTTFNNRRWRALS